MMKKTMIGLIILVLLLVPAGLGEARSYEFTNLHIRLTVDAPGAVHGSENRTVRFHGTFGMYQWISPLVVVRSVISVFQREGGL